MPYCINDNCGVYVNDLDWIENDHLCKDCAKDKKIMANCLKCDKEIKILQYLENNQLCSKCNTITLPDYDDIENFKIELKDGFEWYHLSVKELYTIFKHKIKDELSCSNGELYNNYGD